MPYVSVALRNVPVGRFLCIFYTYLLLITTSIYARIHAASTNVFTHRGVHWIGTCSSANRSGNPKHEQEF
jgi:hypothetical protein